MNTLRSVKDSDAAVLLGLARRCPPLDVHTPYTYWTICRYFGDTSFVVEDEAGVAVGFVTSLVSGETLFLWQIGVLEPWRGAGVSEQLLEAIKDAVIARGLARVETTITPSNGPSNGVFRRYAARLGVEIQMIENVVVPEHEDEEPEVLFRLHLG
jgi:L-2,4-diaminobutyric acid acetyltransferase